MGSYTDNLFKNRPAKLAARNPNAERLVNAAIMRGSNEIHTADGTARSHWEVRFDLGDEYPNRRNPDDIEGFLTSTGRFVTRFEAQIIGEASGQCRPQGRELLSSDIDW